MYNNANSKLQYLSCLLHILLGDKCVFGFRYSFIIFFLIPTEGEGEVRGSKRSRGTGTSVVLVVFFLLTVCLQPVMAQQVLSDSKKKAVDDTAATTTANTKQEKRFKAESATETKSDSTSNKWLIYGGGIALGVGVAAAVAGGGGGGGSSTPACEEPIVGPDLSGSDWAGKLVLYDRATQPVTAIVTHCGNRVLIQTTSTLAYGQAFEGTIKSSGHMLVHDQATLQDWTTVRGPASSTKIEIYDLVNNFHNYDELEIYRTLAP